MRPLPVHVGLAFVSLFIISIGVGFPPAFLAFLLFPSALRRGREKAAERAEQRQFEADDRYARQFR